VEDLGGLVLDGLHLHLVWRILSLAVLDGLGEADGAVGRELAASRAQEERHLLLEGGARSEAARGQPQQLPAPLLTHLASVVGDLLDYLAVDLVFENFLVYLTEQKQIERKKHFHKRLIKEMCNRHKNLAIGLTITIVYYIVFRILKYYNLKLYY